MPLKLMYITNNPDVALIAEKYGVERIWVDLEMFGKEERQKNINSVKSHHTINDITVISRLLTKSEMLVRVNPWNASSKDEIDKVIAAGADMIMLPMWRTVGDVEHFVNAVAGRVKTTLLLETKEAEGCLDEVLKLPGIDEIHIGLNDLHLSYGMTFMFELLANGTVERICKKIRTAVLPYGFGGIAKIGDGMLPSEKIVMEHYRLGSTRVILSRTFCDHAVIQNIAEIDRVFSENIKKLRDFEVYAENAGQAAYLTNQAEVAECVKKVTYAMKEKRNGGVKK